MYIYLGNTVNSRNKRYVPYDQEYAITVSVIKEITIKIQCFM